MNAPKVGGKARDPTASRSLPAAVPWSRQQLTRLEWEDLRPLITRLYIAENKTQASIADVLAGSHGFRPTKKQLTTKITEWNIKKNFRLNERQRVLQSLGPLNGDTRTDVNGQRFQKKRLLRWEKEEKRTNAAPFLVPDPFTMDSPIAEGNLSSGASSHTLSRGSSPTVDNDTNMSLVGLKRKFQAWTREDADGESQLPTNAEWKNDDVLKSPKLTRLLEGLAAEAKDLPDEIKPLTLPELSAGKQNANTTDIVAWPDLMLNSRQANLTPLLNDGGTSLANPVVERESTDELIRRQPSRITRIEFNYFGQDVLLPSGTLVGRPPSPLNELSMFPPHSESPKACWSSLTPSKFRQNIFNQRYDKLKLLKSAGVDENRPVMLDLINRLADLAYDSGQILEANSLYKKFLAPQGRNLMNWPVKVLHAQVGLIDGLCRGGHPLEAKKMLASVSAVVGERFDPSHVISRRLKKAQIEIFNWMEDWDREEPVVRDLAQLCLVHLGPKDPETLHAIYRLGSVMMGQKHFSKSAEIHRLTMQLCHEGTEKHHERMCWSSTSLARVYEAEDKLDEAIQLLRGSNRRAKESLGDENEAAMIGDYRLARILAKKGLLKESEELLRDTLERQIKVLGETHINTVCTMFELGCTLQRANRHPEATFRLEQCFDRSLTLSNFEFMTRFCTQLGSCYKEQGRHEEALACYHKALEFLRNAEKKSDDEHFDVGQYVAKVQDLIHSARQYTEDMYLE